MLIALYYMFVPFQDLTPFYLGAESPRTEGYITQVEKLDNDGSKRYKIYYTFSTPTKKGVEAIGYSDEKKHQKGDKVVVIYHVQKLVYAKIEGTDAAYYNFNTSIIQWLFIMVTFATAMYLFYLGIKTGRLHLALLENGSICEGICIGIEEKKDNEGVIYVVSFEYTVEGERYEINTTTTKQNRYHLSDKTAILYDEQNPQRAALQSDI